eukprot:3918106-Rhodomonas_salina.1
MRVCVRESVSNVRWTLDRKGLSEDARGQARARALCSWREGAGGDVRACVQQMDGIRDQNSIILASRAEFVEDSARD